MFRILTPALLVALVPAAALAHSGGPEGVPFLAGLAHPLGGADHLLAMVAVGLWAARASGALHLAGIALGRALAHGLRLAGGATAAAGLASVLAQQGEGPR